MAARNAWLVLGAAVAFAAWRMSRPRGIRNNNPGNIRHGGSDWRGAVPGTDPAFVTFAAPEWGIRAMARILDTYRRVHGLTTIRQIITRWAPPSENDSTAYAHHVAAQLGRTPDDPVTDADVPALIAAMIEHENGTNPYTLDTIRQGVMLA